jgi:hypothetical protein
MRLVTIVSSEVITSPGGEIKEKSLASDFSPLFLLGDAAAV